MSISRRQFLRAGTIGLASTSISNPVSAATAKNSQETASGIQLNMSGYPLEHIRPLMTGKVGIERCQISFKPGKIGDINTQVFSGPRTLDVTEIGLSPYMLAYANEGFRAYSLIPVFPLRLFRHKSIFVHSSGGIEDPSQLKGKRVGTPGYSSTSLTWIRGLLQDEYGVRPEDIEWVIAATDSSQQNSGRTSAQEQIFPESLTFSTGPAGKDESDLLLDGDVDALFHAAEPRAFVEGHPDIRRLFEDPRQTERDYFARRGIFPVMHAVAIRNELIDQHPWLPTAVFEAYSRAKTMAYNDMSQKWFLRTLPWFAQELKETRDLMGINFHPYGLEPNRKALNTLFRYSHEQGLASRRLSVEEMFVPSTLELLES